MSVNIMDLVKGAVSDQIMGQIGGLLGTDAKKTPSIFETAAGSILGGLMKKATSPQGAQDIFQATQDQDDGILDKLGDLLGGGDSTDELQNQGSGILDMVLGGGQETSGMIGMVAKALGLDKGIVGKLLMMAAPIVMSVIGRHIKNKALDAVGLGKVLGSQGPNLAGILPASLTSDLGLGDMVGQAGNMANSAAGTVDSVSRAASSGGGLMKYILPVGLIALAALFFGPKVYDMMTRSKSAILDNVDNVAGALSFDPTAFDINALGDTGLKLSDGMADVTESLRDVSDEGSANDIVRKLEGFTESIDGLGLGSLEGPAKTAASGMIEKFIEVVKGLVGEKSEGVQGILKPIIEALVEKLTPFK